MPNEFDDILDHLPPTPPRSQIAPYAGLLREMRKRGRTYREIAQVLREKFRVRVAPGTIHAFLEVRAKNEVRTKEKNNPARNEPSTAVSKNRTGVASKKKRADDAEHRGTPWKAQEGILRKFQELKNRTAKTPVKKPLFAYNPDEPLRLPRKKSPKE